MGATLMAVVAEGTNGRLYISPTEVQEKAAQVKKPEDYPEGSLAYYPGHLNTNVYGLTEFNMLFSNRQLTALTTFSELVGEAQEKAKADAVAFGLPDEGIPLSDGGSGATAYGQAVGVYLAFAVDREADISSTIASWINSIGAIRNTFARQAIPMVWDFAEVNLFSNSCGCWDNMLSWVYNCINGFHYADYIGTVNQFDAQSDNGLRNIMVSTDPPYYDNIGYADLSDFFYVWLRQSLKNTYPKLFRTMLVPKAEELVATPYRFDGSAEKAKDFFEDGMLKTCRQIYKYSREDVPVTIYYAYKQSDTETDKDGSALITASTGWETMLTAIIKAGFAITGTWPMRTERAVRSVAMNTNALASSIVLACRRRPEDAPMCTRRDFVSSLRRELKSALKKLQSSNIAPVDMAQAAIGPGIAVYSRYTKVLEASGEQMSVRAALQLINQELDFYFNAQDGELDADSRFCVDLYTQYAFNDIKYGDANVLANAKGTSVKMIESRGAIYAEKGLVHLLTREELSPHISGDNSMIWLLTQQLVFCRGRTFCAAPRK